VGLLAGNVSCAKAQKLTGAGATFPYPLYSKWFDMYHQKTGVQINYQSIGSGGGIQQVKAGTVDFGASDAPTQQSEAQEMPRAVLHFPTVAGRGRGRVQPARRHAAASPLAGDAGRDLHGQDHELERQDDRRGQPGVELPASPIQPVHRSDGSGTTYIFVVLPRGREPRVEGARGREHVVSWPVGIGGKGNEGVAGLVRQTPGTIGYVELA
jgi:phosphate transport system substrate-binding protein